MNKIGKMTFAKRLAFTTILSCVLVAVLLCCIAAYQSYSGAKDSIAELRKNLFADYDALAKSEVETAVSMLQNIHDRQEKGELKAEQAKTLAANVLRGLRFGKEGYFWADTIEGVNVVLLGKKDFEGKSRINLQDKKGKYFVKEFIENGRKEGGGFIITSPRWGATSRF